MNVQWAAILATILLAVIGLVAKYFYDLRLAKRKDRLDLVNRQLNDFYGPLYISTKASVRAIDALKNRLGQSAIFVDRNHPTERELEEWKIWLPSVLMPFNEFKENLILKNSHLIRESEIPDCLLKFVAHVAAYKAVLKKWEKDDYSQILSVIDFPADLDAYATKSYTSLKKEQSILIGKK